MILGMILVTVLSLALATLALGFSAAFAQFKSDRPGEVLGTTGGTANFLTSSALVVLVIGLWIYGAVLGRQSIGGMLCSSGSFLMALGVMAASFFWALRSFRRREF